MYREKIIMTTDPKSVFGWGVICFNQSQSKGGVCDKDSPLLPWELFPFFYTSVYALPIEIYRYVVLCTSRSANNNGISGFKKRCKFCFAVYSPIKNIVELIQMQNLLTSYDYEWFMAHFEQQIIKVHSRLNNSCFIWLYNMHNVHQLLPSNH